MVDTQGIYNKVVNSVEGNQPDWMRNEVMSEIIRVYDDIYTPQFQDWFPIATAPGNASYRTSWEMPYTANLGGMARFMDRMETPKQQRPVFKKEEMQGRVAGWMGPEWDPYEFEDELKTGFLDAANQVLLDQAMNGISRLKEYSCLRYMYGDKTFMMNFGTQYRTYSQLAKKEDLTTIVSSNNKWSSATTSTPIQDFIDLRQQFLNNYVGIPDEAAVGIKTQALLEKAAINEDGQIAGLIKYHHDLMGNLVVQSIKGMKITLVRGGIYKEDATRNNWAIDYPGAGVPERDTVQTGSGGLDYYTPQYRKDIMKLVDTNDEEFMIIKSGNLGNMFSVRVSPKQTNSNLPYVHEWYDDFREEQHSMMKFGFAPFIDDMRKFMIVTDLYD